MKNITKNDIPWYGVVWKTLLVTAVLFAFSFTTANAQTAGETCDGPITVSGLPYTSTDSTSTYGNNYSSSDMPPLAPNAVTNGSSINYLGGDDVVYSYTAEANGFINVNASGVGSWTGLYVFTGCSPFEFTVGSHTSSTTGTRSIPELPVIEGETYYIVISTWPTPNSTDYTINIEEEIADCPDLGLNIGDPCDDGDPNTINDVVNEDCECEGVIPPDGMVCEAPIEITSLPYTTTDNTENYFDNYSSSDRPDLADGAVGNPSSSYLNGDDVVYAYTPTQDMMIDISVTDHGTYAGVFVFTGCPFESTVGGHSLGSGVDELLVADLPVQAGETYYIVISTWASPQSTPYTLTITDVTPSCMAPTNLAVDNITQTDADLSWTTTANQSDIYLVEAGEPAPDENSTPTDTGVTSPATLSNLTNSTTYDVYVRADCGGNDGVSTWTGPLTFATDCGIATVPYTMDFETAIVPNLPACTSQENNGIGNDWKTNSFASGFTGKVLNYSYHPSTPAGPANTWFYTQGIQLYSNVTYDISFLVGNNSTTFTESMKVAYGTAPAESAMVNEITDLPEISTSAPLDRLHSFDPPADGVYYFGFNVYSIEDQNQLYLDDINIFEAPECPNPSNLSVSDIGETSVELSWDHPGANYYNLIVREVDGNQYEPSQGDITDEDLGSSPYTKTGLTPNTDYEFYIIADCDMYWSNFVGPVTFSTLATPPENDDPGDAIALDCDDSYEGTTAAATESMGATQNCATFSSGYSKDVWFSFEADCETEYTLLGEGFDGVIEVYSGDPSDTDSLDAVGCVDEYGQSDELTLGNLDEGTYYVRYFAYSTSSAGDYTMSLTCFLPEPCDNPTDLMVDNIGEDAANVSWTAAAGQDEWQVRYGSEGFDPTGFSGLTQTVEGNPEVTLELDPGTAYDVYVRAICQDQNSDWIGPETFTTEGSCVPSFSGSSDHINSFELEEISNLDSGQSAGGYGDFTDMGPANLVEGNTYTVSLDVTGTGSHGIAIWIDYNDDGVFTADERVAAESGVTSGLVDVNFDVDEGFQGEHTLRIIYRWNTSGEDIEPCSSASYGEGEDYRVNITGDDEPVDCETPTDLSFGQVTFDEDGAHLPVSWTPVGNETQWEVFYENTDDTSDNGTEIVNDDPNTILDLTVGEGYDVQVRAVCDANTNSEWTDTENIFITPPFVDCEAPTDLAVNVGGPTFATVTWSGDADDYEIAWGVSPYSPGDAGGNQFTTGDTNSYGIGTEGGTDYDVYVRAICDETSSEWATISFTSEEGPECEEPSGTTIDNITENSADITWTPADSGDNHWQISITTIGQSPDDGMMDDVFDDASYAATGLDADTNYNVYVRTVCSEDDSSEWYGGAPFTTEEGGEPVDCESPTDLAVNVMGSTTAQVTWTGDADDYEIAWGVSPYSPGDAGGNQFTTGDTNSYGIGTEPGTEYDVYVRAICGDDNSEWTSTSFTSEEAEGCAAPTGTTIDNITEEGADITWTPGDAADDHWEISIAVFGESADDGMMTDVYDDPSYTATGLEADTMYSVFIRTVCDEELSSSWYGAITFTTEESDEPVDCDLEGGGGLYGGDVTVCNDSDDNTVDLIPDAQLGEHFAIVVTDENNLIAGIDEDPEDSIYDFTGFNEGVYEVAMLIWDGDITGLEVGNNAADIDGDCYVWNPVTMEVTVESCEEPEPCEDPYNANADISDVYISNVQMAGIGIDQGNTDYDFQYTSNSMSTDGYSVVTNPIITIYPGLESAYTVSSGPAGNSNQYYYSVWIDFNQDGCFDADEQFIWSNDDIWGGGIPNGAEGVVNVPFTFGQMAPGTYQARIRNSMVNHPMASGNGDGEALDFTINVVTQEEAESLLGVESQIFNNFTYYPNPVENQLNLHAGKLIEQVEVYNLLGQKVIQVNPNALETNLDTDRLQSGVYLMNVTIDGSQKTFRVVKK